MAAPFLGLAAVISTPFRVSITARRSQRKNHTLTRASAYTSSFGGRRRRLSAPRRALLASRASRLARFGRVGRRGGGGGVSASATSSARRATAISWLRLRERSSWTEIRSGRSSSASAAASLSARAGSSAARLSRSMVSSARVEALSRCWPPGPLERLAVHWPLLSSCSTTSSTCIANQCKNWQGMPLLRRAASAAWRTDKLTARAKKAIHLAQEEAQRRSAPLSNGPSTAPARRHRTLVTSLLSPARGKAIDALVAAGIRSTRSDAAAWLIRSAIADKRSSSSPYPRQYAQS